MRFQVVALGAVLATALTGLVARAESVTFDFTTVTLGIDSTYTYNHPSGLSLLVSGTNTIGGTTSSAWVSRTIAGLGVVGGPLGNPLGMDNLLSTESLVFDFTPQEVVIDKMKFNFIDRDADHDEVKLTVIGTGAQTFYDISTQGVGTVNFDFTTATPLRSATQRTGMKFIASTTDWNDNYTIAGLTVEFTRVLPVNAVPVPSAALGGGLLLAGLGLKKWSGRRKAAGAMIADA